MKNKYLTKCLCITLISTMVLASSVSVFAAEEAGTFVSESALSNEADFASGFSDETQAVSATSEAVPTVPDPGFSSEPDTSLEPGEDVTVTPGTDVTPAPGTEVTPDPGSDVTPTPGTDVTPEPGTEVTPTPGTDVTPAPGTDVTPTPGEDVTPTPGEDITPTPGEEITPTPGEDITPTPDPGTEVTPTPDPEADVTPTPEPTVTPTPGPEEDLLTEKAREVVDGINALAKVEITLKHEAKIQKLRAKYDALTKEEKAMVSNYELLEGFEAKIAELKAAEFDDKETPDITDGTSTTTADVKIGTPVYFTNMVSNIHAGKEFYLDTLKKEYHLTFSDDFVSVMDSIEKEYKSKNKLTDPSDSRTDNVTTSADSLLVRNWQDVIAIYVYEKSQEGEEAFTLNSSSKEDLARIFEELNPVVRDKQNITHVSYGNRHINYYIKKNKIAKEDRELLKKYVETDCKILCATVTAAKGFVRQSVGDDVSEERVNVISAAYSLVGKVGYFWGGKSTVFGDDPSWGTAERVTAAGSNSTGTVRAYGLDCSGFVTWAVVNGYHDTSMQSVVGDGTSDQWFKAQVVSEKNAQPGDLVFQRGPEAGSDNHVGILCGKTDSGDWIAVHCSSSKNGVTVGEAYGASFRYIRQPSFYPSEEEVKVMEENGFTSDETEVTVGNTLQDIIKENQFTSKEEKKDNTIMSNVFADMDDVEVFIGN